MHSSCGLRNPVCLSYYKNRNTQRYVGDILTLSNIIADCPGHIMKNEFYPHPSLIIFQLLVLLFSEAVLYESVVSGDWDDKILL